MNKLSKLILLVEDNASDEKLTLMALEKSKVQNQVFVVRDGAEALDFLFATGDYIGRQPASLPSLVLLDLNLPKVNGVEVLRRVRADARTSALPVVILTSSMQDEDVAQGYSSGANAYVRKPVAYAEFLAAAKAIGAFWLALNEVSPMVAR